MSAMGSAIATAVKSEWLAAAARIATIAVAGVGIPFVLWMVSTVNTLDKQVAVQAVRDAQQEQTMKDIGSAIVAMKSARDTDTKAASELAIAMGRALEKLDAHSRTLQRIEQIIDRPRITP